MVVFQKFLGVLSAIAIEALDTGRRVPHDNHLVCDVREVCMQSEEKMKDELLSE